ncbi:conserved hypothetical protein [Agrobacterium deltaense RV3]|nr:conserved hypothetical protein [Agrobacterium deltaense RV3]
MFPVTRHPAEQGKRQGNGKCGHRRQGIFNEAPRFRVNIVSHGRFHHGARGRKQIVPDGQDAGDVDRGGGNRADRIEHTQKNRRHEEKKAQKPQKSFHQGHLVYDLPVRQRYFEIYNASIKAGKPVCNRIGTQEIADISKNCQIRVDPCEFIGIYRAVPVICILQNMQI